MRSNKRCSNQHKFLAFILFFCCLSVRVYASASVTDVHNIAEICTSVQTVLKDYSLVGMGAKYGDPAAHLKETVAKIDKDFSDLKKDHHLGGSIDALVIKNEKLWKKIRAVLITAPNQSAVLKLHQDIEMLDEECWKIAELIAEETHIEGEHYVIVASELGMEVQRLAALYMMRAWDVSNDHYFEEVEAIFQEFEKYYHELEQKAYPKYIDDKTKAKLDKIEKAFSVFKYMAASKTGRFVPSLGQRSARKLNTDINDVTKSIIFAIEGNK